MYQRILRLLTVLMHSHRVLVSICDGTTSFSSIRIFTLRAFCLARRYLMRRRSISALWRTEVTSLTGLWHRIQRAPDQRSSAAVHGAAWVAGLGNFSNRPDALAHCIMFTACTCRPSRIVSHSQSSSSRVVRLPLWPNLAFEGTRRGGASTWRA